MPKRVKEPVQEEALPTLYKATTGGGVMEWSIRVEELKSSGHGRMITTYGLQGGKKQVLSEVISKGKNVGRKNETTPLDQAQLEAMARWLKQKSRKGYGLTVEDSARVRWASPMLAQVYEKQAKKVQWNTAFAQPKLNGFRALARRVGSKVVITSRENQPMPAMAHIANMLSNNSSFQEGVVLDGEMYCHGMPLNKISSACKASNDLSEKVQYHVYDMISDDDFEARQTDLYGILRRSESSLIRSVATVKVRSAADLMVCQRDFLAAGYEGAMLRHGRLGYEAGKRTVHLLKVKIWADAEFEIVDYKMGRGKYAGMPVFTCTTEEGHDFDVLAPGDLDAKRELGVRAAELVGRTLKVRYQEFTKTEEPVPFHPVALCVLEE